MLVRSSLALSSSSKNKNSIWFSGLVIAQIVQRISSLRCEMHCICSIIKANIFQIWCAKQFDFILALVKVYLHFTSLGSSKDIEKRNNIWNYTQKTNWTKKKLICQLLEHLRSSFFMGIGWIKRLPHNALERNGSKLINFWQV